jgi:hypothetical protein
VVAAALELVEVEVGRVQGGRHCAALESRVAGRELALPLCSVAMFYRRAEKKTRGRRSWSIVMLIYCWGWRGFSEKMNTPIE